MILKDYSDAIIARKLSGQELPDRFNGAYNTYYIKEVSEGYAQDSGTRGQQFCFIRL